MPIEFEVVYHATEDDREVVGILVTHRGMEGPETEERHYTWWGPERYKVDTAGKLRPKTGRDKKQEIQEAIEHEYSPKADAPQRC